VRRYGAARIGIALALASAVTACGYFNSLYNAQRKFDDAQRAEAAGSRSTAIAAYEAAIERAAVSYQKYPKSRWADDALLLIGRSHFGRATNLQNEAADSQAVAALQRLLGNTQDESVRAMGFAYLGAARARLGDPTARVALDSAVNLLEKDTEASYFAHLWRARARFAADDTAGAWQDLAAVPPASIGARADATLERVTRAVILADSARWHAAVIDATGPLGPGRKADSLATLIQRGSDIWGAHYVGRIVDSEVQAPLTEEDRLRLQLLRAEIVAQSGDTAAAIADAERVASSSTSETSSRARIRVAQWLLETTRDMDDLQRIRSILVPAYSSGEAVQMIRQIRTLEVLVGRAATDPAAMFVAAEFARDDLHAPHLARELFLRMDSQPTRSLWSGKALLAALDASATDAERKEIEQRIAAAPGDIYLNTARGNGDSTAFRNAESQLRHEMTTLRAEAIAVAAAGDVSVSRAIALRDSIRVVLRTDSIRKSCASAIDSLQVKGVRADSVRAACQRSDTARVNEVLRIDSMKLKPMKADTNAVSLLPHSMR
jgi:hypothetical protein